MSRVLITGIAGSGGSYLAGYLREHRPAVEVHGIARGADHGNLEGLDVTVHTADLCDAEATRAALQAAAPDAVVHLAARADVRASFDAPLDVMRDNVLGTTVLFEELRRSGADPRVLLCSSSEVYGQVGPEDVPIREDCPLRPVSPYAVSKTTQDLLGRMYHQAYGMRVVTTRMFTYLNPRRPDLFATSWARQVARIERGEQTELLHGNLDSERTIIDVRDAMAGYVLALERGESGEVYNIGGTESIAVGAFLERLKALATCEIPHRVDPALLRPADVTLQIPDVSKFVAATGWVPEHSLEQSTQHLLEFWRRRESK